MTLAIHHVALNVRAPERIAALYEQAADFRQVRDAAETLWLAAPTAFVALHPCDHSEAVKPPQVFDPGIGHFCIQAGGHGEHACRGLSAAGIALNAPLAGLGTGVLYAYGRDPEGNLIEVEGVTDEPAETPPWIAHVALVTADLDRLAHFYGRLIGRAPHREGRFAHPAFAQITGHQDVDVAAKWIMADNLIFEMWRYFNPATAPAQPRARGTPGYRHIGFAAQDFAAETARLAAAGIPLQPTCFEGLAAAEGADPDGNRFVILANPPAGHPLAFANLPAPDLVRQRLQRQA